MGDFTLDLKATIAIVAIITAIIIAYLVNWWRNRKSISYEILSNAPLLSANEIIRDRIQILYDGLPVKNVHLLTLKVINDGRLSIVNSDFVKPLCFKFPEDAQILSFEVIDLKPNNLEVELTCKENSLFVRTDLLNSSDSITMKVIASSYKFDLSLYARIVGIKEVRRTNKMITSVRRAYGGLLVVFVLVMPLSLFLPSPINYVVLIVTLISLPTVYMEANDFIKKFRKLERGD